MAVMSMLKGYVHLMVGHEVVVDPHTGAIVHSPKVEQHPTLTFGHQIRARTNSLMKPGVADAALADSERRELQLGPLEMSLVERISLVVKCKLPRAVETNPVRALQLWTRICRLTRRRLVLEPSSQGTFP